MTEVQVYNELEALAYKMGEAIDNLTEVSVLSIRIKEREEYQQKKRSLVFGLNAEEGIGLEAVRDTISLKFTKWEVFSPRFAACPSFSKEEADEANVEIDRFRKFLQDTMDTFGVDLSFATFPSHWYTEDFDSNYLGYVAIPFLTDWEIGMVEHFIGKGKYPRNEIEFVEFLNKLGFEKEWLTSATGKHGELVALKIFPSD